MITLCERCQCDLLKEISTTTGVDVSGLYCAHNQATALVIAQDGEIRYTQLSGPVDAQGAAQLMETFVQELHGPLASLPTGEGAPRH